MQNKDKRVVRKYNREFFQDTLLGPGLTMDDIQPEITVDREYKIQSILGYGATSVVYKAVMSKGINANGIHKKESVAIKKIKNVFESDGYARRVLRELRLLRLLKGHENVSQN